jgi:TIR domain
MARVFIWYRRADSASISERIYDRLVERFRRKNVFKDVDDIPPGVDFADYIQESLRECAAALVVMGPRWLEARDAGGGRQRPGADCRAMRGTALTSPGRPLHLLMKKPGCGGSSSAMQAHHGRAAAAVRVRCLETAFAQVCLICYQRTFVADRSSVGLLYLSA